MAIFKLLLRSEDYIKKREQSDEIEKPSVGNKSKTANIACSNAVQKKTFCVGCQKQEVNNKLCHN